MKYKVLISTIFIAIAFNHTNAQLIRSYGIKAGMVYSGQNWEYARGSYLYGLSLYDKTILGYDVGGYAEWFNLPVLSAVTGIHFLQKGARDELPVTTMDQPDGTGEMLSIKPRLDYLSIELLAKLRYETSFATLYGIAGPRVDFLIGRNKYAEGAVFDDFRSTEFGINIGGGVEFPLIGLYKVGIIIIYNHSLQNTFSNQILTVKSHSTEFLITVGI
jgi:opacity protein-like surface antigen